MFGRVGVGKSSLVNALVGQDVMATDVAHGCTRHQQAGPLATSGSGLQTVDLVDTPGIDEVDAPARARLAARVALHADLVLLVLDGDITRVELDAWKRCRRWANRCSPCSTAATAGPASGCRIAAQHPQSFAVRAACPLAVAAAPRRAEQRPDGRIRSRQQPPMCAAGTQPGHPAGTARPQPAAAEHPASGRRISSSSKPGVCNDDDGEAQGLIGRYAALKATGVAANPLMLLDLAGGMACDAALVRHLCSSMTCPSEARQPVACCAS